MSKMKLALLPLTALILGACAPTPDPVDWTDEDKATMASVLGDNNYLPFMYFPGYQLKVENDHVVVTAANVTEEQVDAYELLLLDNDYVEEDAVYTLTLGKDSTGVNYQEIYVELELIGEALFIDGSYGERPVPTWTDEELEWLEETIPGVDFPFLETMPEGYETGLYKYDESPLGTLFQLVLDTPLSAEGSALNARLTSEYSALLEATLGSSVERGTVYTNGVEYFGTIPEFTWTVTFAYFGTTTQDDESYFFVQINMVQQTPWNVEDEDVTSDNFDELKTLDSTGALVHDGEEVTLRGTIAAYSGNDFILAAPSGEFNNTIKLANVVAATGIAVPEIGNFIKVSGTLGLNENGEPELQEITSLEIVQEQGQDYRKTIEYAPYLETIYNDKSNGGLAIRADAIFVEIESTSPIQEGAEANVTIAFDGTYNEVTGEYQFEEEDLATLHIGAGVENIHQMIGALNGYTTGDVIKITAGIISYDENDKIIIEGYTGTIVSSSQSVNDNYNVDMINSVIDTYSSGGYGYSETMSPFPDEMPSIVSSLDAQYIVLDHAFVFADTGEDFDNGVILEIDSAEITFGDGTEANPGNADAIVEAIVGSLKLIGGGVTWHADEDNAGIYWLLDADGYSIDNIYVRVLAGSGEGVNYIMMQMFIL